MSLNRTKLEMGISLTWTFSGVPDPWNGLLAPFCPLMSPSPAWAVLLRGRAQFGITWEIKLSGTKL